jgi:hypothetical protein
MYQSNVVKCEMKGLSVSSNSYTIRLALTSLVRYSSDMSLKNEGFVGSTKWHWQVRIHSVQLIFAILDFEVHPACMFSSACLGDECIKVAIVLFAWSI